jgi:dienelactone hydrolase
MSPDTGLKPGENEKLINTMTVKERSPQIVVLVATFFLCFHTSFSQTTDSAIQLGKVTDKVVVQSYPDQSYAAFLPAGYSPDRSWPTVFCFDPRARGRLVIERFVQAAEKHGYIVLCSNNSRNGLTGQAVAQIFTDFWDDAHARFSIDKNRTYAAGFSGGARLATTFASRCRGCLAGVIGAGAGFGADIAPDEKTPFAYFGIVGVDDFNFGEMWELEKRLGQLRAPYRFENFGGGHEWAPQEKIEQAFAWLTLQAMKSGVAPKDEKFIDEQFNVRSAAADQVLSGGHYVDALRAFSSIVRDFQAFRDVKLAANKLEQVSKTAELKKEVSTEEELYRRQLREAGEIRMLWMKPPNPDETVLPRSQATVRLADWRKKKELTVDSRDRRLARRILSHLTVESFETAQASLRNNDYNQALTNLQLAKEIDPKNANTAFEIARVYALNRQKKPALQSLEEAVSLGFKDASRLKAEIAFSSLSDEPRYQKLLAAIGGQ